MERFSRFEKNLLQGLYLHDLVWGTHGGARFSNLQLRWLLYQRYWRSIRSWPIDRMHKTTNQFTTLIDNRQVGDRVGNKQIEQSIQVLEERGLITGSSAGEPVFHLALTGSGIALARRCDTWHGRAGIYYEERRNGILGLIVTIAVAAVTSIVTTLITS